MQNHIGALARSFQQFGRRGDSILAHISPSEADLLRRRGGAGSINPVTLLPEFFGPSDGGPGPGEGGTGGGPGGAGTGGGDGPSDAGGGGGGGGGSGGGDATDHDAGVASGLGRGAATDISAGLGSALGGIGAEASDAGSVGIDFTDSTTRQNAFATRPRVGTKQFAEVVSLARQATKERPGFAAAVGALSQAAMPSAMALGINALNAIADRPTSGVLGALGLGGEAPDPDDIGMDGRSDAEGNEPGGSGDFLPAAPLPPQGALTPPAPPPDPRAALAPRPRNYLHSDPFSGRITPYRPLRPALSRF